MSFRKLTVPLIALAVVALSAPVAYALGLQLGQTKEELKLRYDVSVTDHNTGRVTINVTIADEGRLTPLSSVDLMVRPKDGTNFVDLSVALAPRDANGMKVYSVHIERELARRAEIELKTNHLDGKLTPLTWYYHPIKVAEYLKEGERKQG